MRFLALLTENDLRTVMGNTLRYLQENCISGTFAGGLTSNVVRNYLIYEPLPPNLEWKPFRVIELLPARDDEVDVIQFTRNEIDDILMFACTQ